MLFLEAQPAAPVKRKGGDEDPAVRVEDIGEVCPACHNVRLYDKADYFSH